MSKAILNVTGISKPALKTLGNKYGDPGDVAYDVKVRRRTLRMKKMVPLSMRFFHPVGGGSWVVLGGG